MCSSACSRCRPPSTCDPVTGAGGGRPLPGTTWAASSSRGPAPPPALWRIGATFPFESRSWPARLRWVSPPPADAPERLTADPAQAHPDLERAALVGLLERAGLADRDRRSRTAAVLDG